MTKQLSARISVLVDAAIALQRSRSLCQVVKNNTHISMVIKDELQVGLQNDLEALLLSELALGNFIEENYSPRH